MRGLPLVAASGGRSSSRCAGLSLSLPLLLRSTGSRRAGSVAVAHGPSCSAACGIFPDQGSNPCPLHWQADSQPLRHQGSPYNRAFYLNQPNERWHSVLFQFGSLRLERPKYCCVNQRLPEVDPGLRYPDSPSGMRDLFPQMLGVLLEDVFSCQPYLNCLTQGHVFSEDIPHLKNDHLRI